jgi:hypothetical protein
LKNFVVIVAVVKSDERGKRLMARDRQGFGKKNQPSSGDPEQKRCEIALDAHGPAANENACQAILTSWG